MYLRWLSVFEKIIKIWTPVHYYEKVIKNVRSDTFGDG